MTDFLRRLRRPAAPYASPLEQRDREQPAPGGTPLPTEVAAAEDPATAPPAPDAPTTTLPAVPPPATGEAGSPEPGSPGGAAATGEAASPPDETGGAQGEADHGEATSSPDETGGAQGEADRGDATEGGAMPLGTDRGEADQGNAADVGAAQAAPAPGDAPAAPPPHGVGPGELALGATLPAAAPDAAAGAPAGQGLPAGAEPPQAGALSFRDRGRLRRRLRFLRRVRELGFRDLGGLVFDQHRFGRRNEELVAGKLAALHAVDAELRALEAALQDQRPITELREPGISACPRCGALHGSEARFCPSCGVAFRGPRAVGEVGDAAHVAGPPPAAAPAPSAPPWAASPPQPPHPAAPPAAPVPTGDDRPA